MGHTDTIIGGVKCPSVTQIVGMLDKSQYLVPWAAKHGTLKAQALCKYVFDNGHDEPDINNIPEEWFEDNRINREDFWKSPDDLTKEAQDRGIAFHENVERALKEKYGMPTEPCTPDEYVDAVARWTDMVGFVPLEFERKVISKKYMYGGTFDCLGKIDDKLVLPDWKKTNVIGPAYAIQLGGYAGAYAEETGEWVDDGRIIRVYELKKVAATTSFKQMANGWKWSFAGSRVYIEERRYTQLEKYHELFIFLRALWDYANKRGAWADDVPVS